MDIAATILIGIEAENGFHVPLVGSFRDLSFYYVSLVRIGFYPKALQLRMYKGEQIVRIIIPYITYTHIISENGRCIVGIDIHILCHLSLHIHVLIQNKCYINYRTS